ncbi:type II toxin-antitoxin system HicA family toxin [candidate division KSB1 bacterium]|nr:type II toxin-antitoxin system HicA family toxin [candidate division KSB1 bacterium]
MSPKLKLCSGSKAVQKLQRVGWEISRQKGSHVMMTKSDYPYTLSIPQHKELGIGILSKILKQANLTIDKFNEL